MLPKLKYDQDFLDILNAPNYYLVENNFNWAKRHYDNFNMYNKIDIEDIDGFIYISADMTVDHYYENNTILTYDKKNNKYLHNCSCRFHSKQVPCGHVFALLMLINDLEIKELSLHYDKNIPLNKQDNAVSKLVEEYHENHRKSVIKSELAFSENLLEDLIKDANADFIAELDSKQYTLEFHLENYYALELGLKISDGNKSYKIKNIMKFIHDIQYNNFVTFGKFIAFKLNINKFDKHSQFLINLLKPLVGENSSNNATILIKDHYLDYLFDSVISGQLDNGSTPDLYLQQELKIPITIKQDDDYYLISNDRISYLFSGNYFYNINDNSDDSLVITRFNSNNNKIANDLIYSLNNNSFLRLTQQQFVRFQRYILNPLKENIIYKEGQEFLGHFDYEDKLSIYSNLDNEILTIDFIAEYEDGSKVNVLDPSVDKTFSDKVDKAKVIMENYQDFIEGNKYVFDINSSISDDFLHYSLPLLQKYCAVYVSDSIKRLLTPKTTSIDIGVKVSNNLLELNFDTDDLDKDEIIEIMKAYRKKNKFYKMSNGDLIALQTKQFEELDNVLSEVAVDLKDLNNGAINVPLYRGFQINDTFSNLGEIQTDKNSSFENFIKNFDNDSIDKIQINEKYSNILRDYQVYGVKWLTLLNKYGFGGILADDMGLGKTLQTIAFLETIDTVNLKAMIVTPASLMLNWLDEFKKFNSDLKVLCISGTLKERKELIKDIDNFHIIITTYDYMRKDVELYDNVSFDCVILDEAHYIKNHITKSAKAVKKLHSKQKIALTGTPIENSLAELWSIFDYMMPSYLFNYNYFKKTYETPIVKNNDIDKSNNLKKLVEPFILRRNKKDVLKELPDKIEKTMFYDFSKDEKNLYVSLLSMFNEDLQNQLQMESMNKVLILKMLSELRQICCEPRILYDNIKNISSKLEGALDLIQLQVANKKKILLFSSFTTTLDLISKELDRKGISWLMLTGATKKEQRRELVNEFQNGDVDVFLISLKAGGTGLNLTAAEVVIHYDPWWNQSAQNQATDRAHRIGQENKVEVYQLIMKNSIEEKIMELQKKKKEIADAFIENNTGSISAMNKDDIIDLFKME